MFIGESERVTTYPETTDIYKKHIKPSDTVVVVGPSTSIFNDTTAFLVSNILAGQGTLYVVDPQVSGHRIEWEEISKRAGGYVIGAGAIDRHLKQLRALRRLGMQLTTPKWLGKGSSAQRMNLPDSSCDVVADHNTALFIAGLNLRGASEIQEAQRYQRATDIFREYARVLKTGGTLLFQTSLQYDLKDERLVTLLQSIGIEPTKFRVDDNVRISVPPEVYKKITSLDDSLPIVDDNPYYYQALAQIIHKEGENYYFLFNKPGLFSDDSIEYWCPDFYIGKKL